jgi:hypothetical protein
MNEAASDSAIDYYAKANSYLIDSALRHGGAVTSQSAQSIGGLAAGARRKRLNGLPMASCSTNGGLGVFDIISQRSYSARVDRIVARSIEATAVSSISAPPPNRQRGCPKGLYAACSPSGAHRPGDIGRQQPSRVELLALIKEIPANEGNLAVRYSCLAAHFERAATYCK